MPKRAQINECDTHIFASGVADLQLEKVSQEEIRIGCPNPSGPFVLSRIHQTIESIKGRECSVNFSSEDLVIKLENIKHISDDLFGLGGDCWMKIRNGYWGIGKGLP